tara:strand:+ start:402 stop:710 length:309 start_codon:yes stop_codon:yes gene_type:complete
MKIVVMKSSKPGKRLMAIFDSTGGTFGKKTVHFGVEKPKIGTFIDTGDKTLRKNYIARHQVREKKFYNDPMRAATLSRFLLWGETDSLKKNIELYKKKFNLD